MKKNSKAKKQQNNLNNGKIKHGEIISFRGLESEDLEKFYFIDVTFNKDYHQFKEGEKFKEVIVDLIENTIKGSERCG